MFWADEDVEFIEATYEPGGASSPDDALVRHSGHEFGYVLSGTLRVVVGFDEFVLGPATRSRSRRRRPTGSATTAARRCAPIWVVRGRRGAQPGTSLLTDGDARRRFDNGRLCAASLNTVRRGKDRSSTASRFEQRRRRRRSAR